jgi:hypothetical protein
MKKKKEQNQLLQQMNSLLPFETPICERSFSYATADGF